MIPVRWTEREKQFLRDNAKTTTLPQLRLGLPDRTYAAIRKQLWDLRQKGKSANTTDGMVRITKWVKKKKELEFMVRDFDKAGIKYAIKEHPRNGTVAFFRKYFKGVYVK